MARTFRSQKCKKTEGYGALLDVQMSKKCTPLWREAHFEVKMLKAPGVRTTFGGSDVASLRFASLHYTTLHYTTPHYTALQYITLHYTPLQLQLQLHNYTPLHSTTLFYTKLHYATLHYTTLHSATLHYITLHYLPLRFTTLHYTTLLTGSEHFWTFKCRFAWQAQGMLHLVKREQNVRVLWHCKAMAGVWHSNRIWKDVFCVAGAVQETCSSEMSGGQGPYFQHQIFRFARMIFRDRCSTSYDLASLFRGRRNTLDRWRGKIA